MKKILALFLILSLLTAVSSCGKEKAAPQELPVEAEQEVPIPKSVSAAVKEPAEAKDGTAQEEKSDATKEDPSETETEAEAEAEEAPLNPASMEPEEDHTWEEDAPPAL